VIFLAYEYAATKNELAMIMLELVGLLHYVEMNSGAISLRKKESLNLIHKFLDKKQTRNFTLMTKFN